MDVELDWTICRPSGPTKMRSLANYLSNRKYLNMEIENRLWIHSLSGSDRHGDASSLRILGVIHADQIEISKLNSIFCSYSIDVRETTDFSTVCCWWSQDRSEWFDGHRETDRRRFDILYELYTFTHTRRMFSYTHVVVLLLRHKACPRLCCVRAVSIIMSERERDRKRKRQRKSVLGLVNRDRSIRR